MNPLEPTKLTAPEDLSTTELSPAQGDSDKATLARLARLPTLEYERVREAEAASLGCRVAILDAMVAEVRQSAGVKDLQGQMLDIRVTEPWTEPINASEVLSEVSQAVSRYVSLPSSAADVIALWIAHTYVYDVFEHTPRLNIASPEKRCGKTTLRDVIAEMVCRPLTAENISLAVLFRAIEKIQPTILIDECDSWLNDKDELRAALNAGHKRGGKILRCDGDSNEICSFSVFAPVVLCGIGSLPGTLSDRSIRHELVRAKRGEIQARFDSRHTIDLHILARKLARLGADSREMLEECDPVLPDAAYNRVADNWRPLFAIAEIVGGEWPKRIEAAFGSLVSKNDLDEQGIGTMLLADIQKVFDIKAKDRMFSRDLVTELNKMKDRPWCEEHKGKPITERWLALHLRRFKIQSRTLRMSNERAKGYELSQFDEVFERYLDAPAFLSVTA